MKRACAIVLVLLLTLSAVGCTGQNQQQDSVYKTNLMLDTIVQITLYDWEDSSTIDLAFDEIRRLESLLSVEQEGSDLYRLAQAAGKEWVEISSETEEVLRLSKEYYTLSQGHFDVTIGPLVDLWNIHNGEGHYPTQEELDVTLPLINSNDLLVEEGRAYLAREGMIANLGAIAKGYIADRVKDLLVEQGVEHAVIDLGRNILLIGGRPDGSNFTVGVQDPNQEEGRFGRYRGRLGQKRGDLRHQRAEVYLQRKRVPPCAGPLYRVPGRYWPGVRNHPFGQLRPGRRPVHHLPAAGT